MTNTELTPEFEWMDQRSWVVEDLMVKHFQESNHFHNKTMSSIIEGLILLGDEKPEVRKHLEEAIEFISINKDCDLAFQVEMGLVP